MKRYRWIFAAALLLLTVTAQAAPLEIGAAMPAFSLKSATGPTVSSGDFANRPVLAVVFSCNTCPYSRAYQQRLITMQQEYANQGVQFVVVNPNDAGKSPGDSYEAMQKRVSEMNYPFPYLHDESQQVTKAYGASRTPEVFLFGPDRKLVYRGQIDDNTEESQVRQQHLRAAIDATLKGAPGDISQKTTRAFGCTIKWR